LGCDLGDLGDLGDFVGVCTLFVGVLAGFGVVGVLSSNASFVGVFLRGVEDDVCFVGVFFVGVGVFFVGVFFVGVFFVGVFFGVATFFAGLVSSLLIWLKVLTEFSFPAKSSFLFPLLLAKVSPSVIIASSSSQSVSVTLSTGSKGATALGVFLE
jgi:hypothetical protein